MPGSLIREYLIGLGFEIDESGASSAQSILDHLQQAALQLDDALKRAAAAWSDAMGAMRQAELPDLTFAGDALAELYGAAEPLIDAAGRMDAAFQGMAAALGAASAAADFSGLRDADEGISTLRGSVSSLSDSAHKADAALRGMTSAAKAAASVDFSGLQYAEGSFLQIAGSIIPLIDSAKRADGTLRGVAASIASAASAAEFPGLAQASEDLAALKGNAAQVAQSAIGADEAIHGIASAIGTASAAAGELIDSFPLMGEAGEAAMNRVQATATTSAGQLRAQYARAALAVIQSLQRMAAAGRAQMASLQAGARGSASGIQSAYRALGAQTASIFRSMESSMTTSMTNAATRVIEQVERIKAALLTLPKNIPISVSTGGKFKMGGVVDRETQATIGEDGREYIIPVTKPARALPLIAGAMKDLGLIDGAQRARDHLCGAGGEGAARLIQTTVSRELHTTQQTVSAPATINVYGTQAAAVAKRVQQSHEALIIRNLKGALS